MFELSYHKNFQKRLFTVAKLRKPRVLKILTPMMSLLVCQVMGSLLVSSISKTLSEELQLQGEIVGQNIDTM